MNPNIDGFKLGRRIRQQRCTKKLSVKDLANLTEITPRYLEDIERGIKVPKLDTFVKMINILETSVDFVLQDSLVIGYQVKSSYLQSALDKLAPAQREQVLKVVETMIETYR